MIKLSFRDVTAEAVILRLQSLQRLHDNLLDQMFAELKDKFVNKEVAKTFWEAIPADLRSKYMSSVQKVREQIRDIIKNYPQYYEQYKKQNKPYFLKERQRELKNQEWKDSFNNNIEQTKEEVEVGTR